MLSTQTTGTGPGAPSDDDFDSLFDGPTQHTGPAFCPSPCSGDPRPGTKDASGQGFLDDWEDDDLLNDSLVLEMTQNPFKFAAPKLNSTQIGARLPGPVPGPKPETPRQRSSFRLGAQQNFSLGSDSRSTTLGHSGLASAVLDGFLDEDLEAAFSCEPNWDDPADDDLLCKVCDNLETQIRNWPTAVPVGPTVQSTTLQPRGGAGSGGTQLLQSVVKKTDIPAGKGSALCGALSYPAPPTSLACSAAEIAQKKRRAMERRCHRRRGQIAGPAHMTRDSRFSFTEHAWNS